MEFFEKRIVVKSTPKNWEKEESWIKSNTFRVVKWNEYHSLIRFIEDMQNNPWKDRFIVVRNTDTWDFFERIITDITYLKDFRLYEKDDKVEYSDPVWDVHQNKKFSVNEANEIAHDMKKQVEFHYGIAKMFIISFKTDESFYIDEDGDKVYL